MKRRENLNLHTKVVITFILLDLPQSKEGMEQKKSTVELKLHTG